MLGIPNSTYYEWYARWTEGGFDALGDKSPRPRSVWNRIPDETREDIVEFALEHEDRHRASWPSNTPMNNGSFSPIRRSTASSRPRT